MSPTDQLYEKIMLDKWSVLEQRKVRLYGVSY